MEESSKNRIIISGPTASGKSSFAINLAQKLNAEIVNIDSVQVYKDYDIGSAKPETKIQNSIKHHLIDIISPNAEFNVYDYNLLLKNKLKELDQMSKNALIVGGSTLYIKTFLEGIANLDNKNKILELRKKLEEQDKKKLFQELLEIDKEAASKISENDKFRIVRALELIKIYNLPLSKIIEENMHDSDKNNALILVLCRDRKELHNRINKRTENMMKAGLVEEAKFLISKYGNSSKIFKTLGLKEVLMTLSNELEASKLLEEVSKNTRRYAKRQMTFWRNEPRKNSWDVFESDLYETVSLENVLANRLNFNQVSDLIDDYLKNKEVKTKVVYLDANYINKFNS